VRVIGVGWVGLYVSIVLWFVQIRVHNIRTWHKNDLHVSNSNLCSYKKGAHYAWIKFFNTLPSTIKSYIMI
jgi:hypothetical protein